LRDRPPPNRARLRARPHPLGRRAHLRLAAPLQAPTRPLRPPPRHPRSLPRDRLLPRLLQEASELIVIRVLKPTPQLGRARVRDPGNEAVARWRRSACAATLPKTTNDRS